MPKSFEEIMRDMPVGIVGIPLPPFATGPRKVKAKPQTVNPGWRKLDEPEGERVFLNFIPKRRRERTRALINLYCEQKGENFDWVFDKIPDCRLVIHGHDSTVPCSTPDGCYEYVKSKGIFDL